MANDDELLADSTFPRRIGLIALTLCLLGGLDVSRPPATDSVTIERTRLSTARPTVSERFMIHVIPHHDGVIELVLRRFALPILIEVDGTMFYVYSINRDQVSALECIDGKWVQGGRSLKPDAKYLARVLNPADFPDLLDAFKSAGSV